MWTGVLIVEPYNILVQYNIGYNYQRLNDFERAIIHYKLCLSIIEKSEGDIRELNEFRIKCLNGLGSIYFFVQNKDLSKYYFEMAYNIDQKDPDVNNQMAVVYTDQRLSKKAIYHYEKGIENVDKAHISNNREMLIASMYMNMGLMYTFTGDILKGIDCYNKSLKYKPGFSLAYQNKLLDINYISHKVEPSYIAKLHKNIDKCYNIVYKSYKDTPHLRDYKKKSESEKLRIGFLSGDFICHPVSYFTSCIFDNMDTSKFDIYCYSTKVIRVESRYPKQKWCCIKGMETGDVLNLMLKDSLDILVDLSGNTGDNRMDVLALKPAPMIISMIGYPNTTGLSSVDYRLTDRIVDNEVVESFNYYSEKLLRMKDTFLCYSPGMIQDTSMSIESQLIVLPKLVERESEIINFGCFNRFNKLSDITVRVWCEILSSIKNSRLILKTKEFASEEIIDRLKEMISEYEMETGHLVNDRIELLDYKDNYEDHFLDYNILDVALDTFPYGGTTTTCEALIMGVPVVTLRDNKTHVHSQNVGSSILKNSGMGEWVTSSIDAYKRKCIECVSGIPNKKSIRDRFTKGKVYDKKSYMREMENILRKGYKELLA
jgi:predicted O-linked N-acetylglucosamine transferase (SPINDLY family)